MKIINFFLKSEEFDKIHDYQAVKEKTIEVLNSFSVIALFLFSLKRLNFRISQLRDDGVTLLLMDYGVPYKFVNIDCNKLAKVNKNVRTVLEIVNRGFNNWHTLYIIYEILENDTFEPILKKSKNVKRFSQTANYYRHTDDGKHPLPSKPMALSEAQYFIEINLLQWLSQKEIIIV